MSWQLPYVIFFNFSLESYSLRVSWRRSNVCPIFKSGDPSIPSNCRPVSLLNTIENVFEKIIYKHAFNYLIEIRFFTPSQSGFLPGDSTINQLIFLYNKTCKALDESLEIRFILFDISKAFDNVWRKGLILKRAGKLLSWFSDYLSTRCQRVVLPDCQSNTKHLNACVPQGSILGSLLFLGYMNDIVENIESGINLFVDDTSLSLVDRNPDDTGNTLQNDINKINTWADTWLVKFNLNKSESLVVSRKNIKPIHPDLNMSNILIPNVQTHKHLRIHLSSDGSWDYHINSISRKAWKRINVMHHLKKLLDRKSLQVYFSFIRPILEYGDVIWNNIPQYLKDDLDKIQNEAARIVKGCSKLVSLSNLQQECGWESLSERRRKHNLTLFYKMVKGFVPPYLSSLVPHLNSNISNYNLRNVNNIARRTHLYKNSFLPSVVDEWNLLPQEIRNLESVSNFMHYLNIGKPNPNKLFFVGKRQFQIIHASLRNDCSSLKHNLLIRNILDSPLCVCGALETNQHYFFECPLYRNERNLFLRSISHFS